MMFYKLVNELFLLGVVSWIILKFIRGGRWEACVCACVGGRLRVCYRDGEIDEN